MSLLLVPYNDSMRLGQGFNSFTHELCIDRAVKVPSKPKESVTSANQSQVVSYSSRFVEKLSDVVDSMNVSYCSSVKKGTIEISGNTSTVDETTFKASDLNAVVSVKVVNQTQTLEDGCEFQAMDGVPFGTDQFNQVYGDCYISGFIEGGEFTGIVSMRVVDKTNKQHTVNAIKTAFSNSNKEGFTLDPFDSGNASQVSSATKGTECTVSVSWMGGGQIKDEQTIWDLDTMYKAAAAFPSKVATCPQRTWAILTKYKANRSFVKQAKSSCLKMLEYDQISSFTAELFDNYMEYKLLLKQLQNIINNRNRYKQKSLVLNAIDTSMSTLISVRSALRSEQSKIVDAMDVLSKDPGILKRQKTWARGQKSPLVNAIIKAALGDWYETGRNQTAAGSVLPSTTEPSVPGGDIPVSLTGESAPNLEEIVFEVPTKSPDDLTPDKGPDTNVNASGSAPTQNKTTPEGEVTGNQLQVGLTFDFDALVPPEIWEDVMPEPIPEKLDTTSNALNPTSFGGLGLGLIPTPPVDGYVYPEARILKSEADHKKELEAAKAETESLLQKFQETRKELESMTDQVRTLDWQNKQLNADFSSKLSKETAAKAAAEQARDSVLIELKSEKEKATTEKDRADDLQRRRVPGPPADRPRVKIYQIIWGEDFILDNNVWFKAYNMAESKEYFTPEWLGLSSLSDMEIPHPSFPTLKFKIGQLFDNQALSPFFGSLPNRPHRTGCITYRLDDKGDIRHLLISEGQSRRFDGW